LAIGLDHILRLGRTVVKNKCASLQLDKRPMNKGKNVNPKLQLNILNKSEI
jgi:hypothetical protein